MSPYPMDPTGAVGPMRLVVCVFPRQDQTAAIIRGAVERQLAACANALAAESVYAWKGAIEAAPETVVWFKTSPKKVGALFRYLARSHPYEVPDLFEVDIARVHPPYLRYLAETIDRAAPPPPLGGGLLKLKRRGARRVRGARAPGRTRAPRRPRSR